MYALQRALEQRLRPGEPVFLDRALPDSLTFYRFSGLNPNLILSDCLQFRYAGVFVLDRLPFQQDDARLDHDPTSDLLDAWLFRDYSALGYQVRRLPVLPPERRLEYLLDSVGMRPADKELSDE